MTDKPKALALAEKLRSTDFDEIENSNLLWDVQFELRRLHQVNQELLGSLRGLLDAHAVPSSICKERPAYDAARAAIAKAEGGAA